MRCKVTFAVLTVAGMAVMPATADTRDRGAFSLLVENDIFYASDRDYTNGLQFAYTTAARDTPDWAVDVARWLPFFSQTGTVRTSYAIGQNIYTPATLNTPNPPLDQRPYAGFLYGSIGVLDDTKDGLDQFQVTLGVVGPASLAEEAQKFVHAILRDRKPLGWSTQLRDEPGLELTYEKALKLIPSQSFLGAIFDIEPHYGAAVGNIYDYANVGALARIGFNLPDDYGVVRIEPSLPSASFFDSSGGLGGYIFAGVDGRAIARNLFLDGNTWQRSRSVQKMNLVGDLEFGAAITFRDFRLAFTHVIRTKEYKSQTSNDQFGAINLTFEL